jgi:Uncharacterised protein family (UPF0158).
MIQLSKDQIKSIAGDLEMGMKCYCSLDNNEIVTLPDFDNNIHAEVDLWEKEIEKLNKNFDRYVVIESMSSHKAFNTMVEFIDSIDDQDLKRKLIYLLNRPHPFRSFKNEIDYSGEYRDKWFRFKEERYIEWVESQIEEYNSIQNFER